MQLFDQIIKLEKSLKDQSNLNQFRAVQSGMITHIKPDGAIRVKNDLDENDISYWLQPTSIIRQFSNQLREGMRVLYVYPTSDSTEGYYFTVLHPDFKVLNRSPRFRTIQRMIDASLATIGAGLTLATVQTWVNTTYDAAIKSYITGLAYTTLTAVQTWVNGTYDTAIKAYITGLGYLVASTFNTAQTTRDQNILRIYRYISQLNTYIQGGDYAIAQSWVNRCVIFVVNDTNYSGSPPLAGYMPVPFTSGNTVEYKNSSYVDTKYRIICNSTANTNMPNISDVMYIRNCSRFRMYVRGNDASITVNGSASTDYLISPLSQWSLTRSGANAYTLTDVGYNFLPY